MGKTIEEIIQRYYEESVGGIVDKAPSVLNRGEGTEKEFYILKIDLSRSTAFVSQRRSSQTYLKLAHTFLSSVDEITRFFGADESQAEYAGDSVIAYFRATPSFDPMQVLMAAYWSRKAALKMRALDKAFSQYPFHTKTVLHFGKLIMANIGPYGDKRLSAIGAQLHVACKMESDVSAGEGKASKQFAEKLDLRQRRQFLKANITEYRVEKPYDPLDMRRQSLSEILGAYSTPPAISGLRTLASIVQPLARIEPKYEVKTEVKDYSIKWDDIETALRQAQDSSR